MQKKERAKNHYIEGKSISHIATALGISRATIYNYKRSDLECGIDWDALRYAKATSKKGIEASEKRFLATLISEFETAFEQLQEEPPQKRLQILTNFASAYYKLKQPHKGDCKSAKLSGASEAIYAIAQLAAEEKEERTVAFLSRFHERVIERVLSRVKG